MALSLNRLSSRLICASLLAVLLALSAASAMETDGPQPPAAPTIPLPASASASLAQAANTPSTPPPENPKPILIVWAHTDIPDQGAPTLDLVDLERYFVQQLADRAIENVAPSATTKSPNPPAPNIYLIEVSVDTMRLGKRSTWNDTMHQYDDHDIFEVDLALSVKQSLSGRVVGTSGERHEHWFTPAAWDDEKRLTEKRAAIFQAADNLADRFVDEWARGKYGEDLPRSMVQSDLEKLIEQATLATGLSLPALACIAVASTVFLIILFVFIRALAHDSTESRRIEEETAALEAQVKLLERKRRDTELTKALALSLKTDSFAEPACRAAAAAQRDHLLANHAEIEAKEAERLADGKARAARYEKAAAYASSTSELGHAAIVDILRKAEEWEYRVLQEAKKLAMEVPR